MRFTPGTCADIGREEAELVDVRTRILVDAGLDALERQDESTFCLTSANFRESRLSAQTVRADWMEMWPEVIAGEFRIEGVTSLADHFALSRPRATAALCSGGNRVIKQAGSQQHVVGAITRSATYAVTCALLDDHRITAALDAAVVCPAVTFAPHSTIGSWGLGNAGRAKPQTIVAPFLSGTASDSMGFAFQTGSVIVPAHEDYVDEPWQRVRSEGRERWVDGDGFLIALAQSLAASVGIQARPSAPAGSGVDHDCRSSC